MNALECLKQKSTTVPILTLVRAGRDRLRCRRGRHTLEFDFKYDGLGLGTLAFNNVSGIDRGGTGVLKVDSKEVARQTIEHTIPLIMQWDENFDIGADTGTPVSDDYLVPFKFTGALDKLTLKIDRPQLSPADIQKLKEATRNNRAAEYPSWIPPSHASSSIACCFRCGLGNNRQDRAQFGLAIPRTIRSAG